MGQNTIRSFPQYILRTPAFPIQTYLNLLENYSQADLLQKFNVPYFREAIALASPELYDELDKWLSNPTSTSTEKQHNLSLGFLKYIARMSSRCTPFGIFSVCGVGRFGTGSNVILIPDNNRRHTQFDMHFWISMLQEISKREDVRHKLTYSPNNSIYILGDFYRFIEYKYVKSKREHSISALKKTEILDIVYQAAQKDITIDEMVNLIAADSSEEKEAKSFIHELIDFQFLVSNLDSAITGDDEWQRVLDIMEPITALEFEVKQLQNIKKELAKLDSKVVSDSGIYRSIKKDIQKMGFAYEDKYLFQTDMYLEAKTNILSTNIPGKIKQALYFLNGIRQQSAQTNLSYFIKNFTLRYESREMPLMQVLDPETGIGYMQSDSKDTHDILDAFSFKSTRKANSSQSWDAADGILEKKLQSCIANQQISVLLTESDFPNFSSSWDFVPDTFSVMAELYKENNEEIIAIESSGGISATKLLGRFCQGSHAIYEFAKTIAAKEERLNPDKILAEIAHVPQSRTGNILRRPVLRQYEIAYLANSGTTKENTISVDDLMVSVSGNKIQLRCRKRDKIIVPCLSSAHNFSQNSLPVYHFLCDMQSQSVQPVFSFSWGILESHYDYFPRVMYKSIILAKAKWLVNSKELASFAKLDPTQLISDFTTWRLGRKIPQYVNWVQSDNTLLLDFEKEICMKLFLKSILKYPDIVLEEFLFENNSLVVDDKENHYANQVIVSFYKE